jgi:cation diffusion facilitator family transporter
MVRRLSIPLPFSDLASRAAALSFASNATLLVLKLIVGIVTGSIAVLSDAVDSAEDAVASTFAFFSVRVSARPPDAEHPYGHGKVESLAAVAQSTLIAGGGVFIIVQAVRRLLETEVEISVGPGLAAMVVTAVVNLGVAVYVSRAARTTGSLALRSDARHLWTNIAQAAAVILALALVGITGRVLFDPIVALLLAAYLLWTAAQVFRIGLEEIMDVRLPPEEIQVIEECIAAHCEGTGGYHDLRTRKSGRQRYVDLHLTAAPSTSLEEVHAICDRIEGEIVRRLPGAVVTIHVEPESSAAEQR